MNRPSLRRVVTQFRSGILGKRPDPNGMCYAVCWPLDTFLRGCGYETELVEGEVNGGQHFWLKLSDGLIVDPTADQFSTPERPMPKVYIGPLPEWYKPCGRRVR